MTDTVARLRSGNMVFETMVDLESAMKMKKGENVSISEVVRDTCVYNNQKKGMKAGDSELENAFGTTQFEDIVKKIVEKGEIEVTQEYRDEATERRKKQIIDFLTKNAVDSRTDRPFTPETIESSLKEAGVNIENKSVENQIWKIIDKLKTVIPLKIETKKIKVVVPAQHTGKAYGLLQDYKEKEEWQSNGNLEVILNLPVGIQSEFYDKLNSVTHGSVLTEEIKE